METNIDQEEKVNKKRYQLNLELLLPDLGPGVELFISPKMDVGFDVAYMSSHEPRMEYLGSKDFDDCED